MPTISGIQVPAGSGGSSAATSIIPSLLTPRWYPLAPHEKQCLVWNSGKRFLVVPAGRRSGKTELAKRKIVKKALTFHSFPDGRFVCAAPTYGQAKQIFWSDLKAMVPPELTVKISESELTIWLWNGAHIRCMGMEEPARIEGSPLDGLVFDEYGNSKPHAWPNHARPALSTRGRQGWAMLIGVPEGRNHYYDLWMWALANADNEWEGITWKSSEILPPEEIEAARRDLDPLTFAQEYEGSFVTFEGRAYYTFSTDLHASQPLEYDPTKDLIFAFDFNVSPGVAAVGQETRFGTEWIGEVYIPSGSNSLTVSRKLAADWKHHERNIFCYGDATGGAKGSAKVLGSDWDLVKSVLRPAFGDRVHFRIPDSNPLERARVNAVNTRFLAADGRTVRMRVCPKRAPHLVKDFEGVRILKGSDGEIDKKSDEKLTHISDAAGYYVVAKFPLGSHAGLLQAI